MAEVFKKIPSALKKQILIRLAGSGLGIVMLILILSYRGNWQLIIPGIAIFLAFFGSAALLFIKCAGESYVVIRGECVEIEKTGLRKRIKSVYIQQDGRRVKIRSSAFGTYLLVTSLRSTWRKTPLCMTTMGVTSYSM